MSAEYGESQAINALRNGPGLGLDFEARVATSDIYKALCECQQQYSLLKKRILDRTTENPKFFKDSRDPFPLFPEEQNILDQVKFLSSHPQQLKHAVEVDGLPQSHWHSLMSKGLKLVERWHNNQTAINSKGLDKETENVQPRSKMTILMAASTANHFLHLACVLLDTNTVSSGGDRSAIESALAMARWYEDIEMMAHATQLRRANARHLKGGEEQSGLLQFLAIDQEAAPNTTLWQRLSGEVMVGVDLRVIVKDQEIKMSNQQVRDDPRRACDLAEGLMAEVMDKKEAKKYRETKFRLENYIIWCRQVDNHSILPLAVQLQMNVHALVHYDIVAIPPDSPPLLDITKDSDRLLEDIFEVLSRTSHPDLALSLLRLVQQLCQGTQKHKVSLEWLLEPLKKDYKGLIWYRLAEQFAAGAKNEVKFVENVEERKEDDVIEEEESRIVDRQRRMKDLMERRERQQGLIENCKLTVTATAKTDDPPLNPALLTNTLVQHKILCLFDCLHGQLGEQLNQVLQDREEHLAAVKTMRTDIKEMMRTLIESAFQRIDIAKDTTLHLFKIHPSHLCFMIRLFMDQYWVYNTQHPENFIRVEACVLQYSINVIESDGLVFAQNGCVSILEETWLEKINHEFRQRLCQHAPRDVPTGLLFMNGKLIKVLHEQLLGYNTPAKGHMFDMLINSYLSYLQMVTKADLKNFQKLCRSPTLEEPAEEDALKFYWDEDALVPMIFVSLMNRMPIFSRFSLSRLTESLFDVFEYHHHHRSALYKALESETCRYEGCADTPRVYAALFDLMKNSGRYWSQKSEHVTYYMMKISQYSPTFSRTFKDMLSRVTERVEQKSAELRDLFEQGVLAGITEPEKDKLKKVRKQIVTEHMPLFDDIQADMSLLQLMLPQIQFNHEQITSKDCLAMFKSEHFFAITKAYLNLSILCQKHSSAEGDQQNLIGDDMHINTKHFTMLLTALTQRFSIFHQLTRGEEHDYDNSPEKFFFKRVERCLASIQSHFGEDLRVTSTFEQMLQGDQFKMFGWALDSTELLALMKLSQFSSIFSSHQLIKLILFNDWSPYADVIVHVPIMIRNTRKSLEMEVLRGVTERSKELSVGIEEELSVVKGDGGTRQAVKALQHRVNEYLGSNCFWTKANSSQSEHMALLQLIRLQIQKRADGMHRYNYPGHSIEQNANANLKFIADELTEMIKTDLTINPALEEDPVLAYINNGNILDMIRKLDHDKRLFINGNTLVNLFAKDGITQLCQLYNQMIEKPPKMPQQEESSFDQTLVTWQHESHLSTISTILNTLIELPMLKDDQGAVQSFEALDIEKSTEPYSFTSLQHFFCNYYNHLLEVLIGWDGKGNLGEKLQKAASARQKNNHYEPVLKLIELAYMRNFDTCPMLKDDYQPRQRQNRDHGWGQPPREPARPARQPTPEETMMVTAIGFLEDQARFALLMTGCDVERAVAILVDDPASVQRYMEEEIQKQSRQEQDKKKQADLEHMSQFMAKEKIKIISVENFRKKVDAYELEAYQSHFNASRAVVELQKNWHVLTVTRPSGTLNLTPAWVLQLFRQLNKREKKNYNENFQQMLKVQLLDGLHGYLNVACKVEFPEKEDVEQQETLMKQMQQLELNLKLTSQQLKESKAFRKVFWHLSDPVKREFKDKPVAKSLEEGLQQLQKDEVVEHEQIGNQAYLIKPCSEAILVLTKMLCKMYAEYKGIWKEDDQKTGKQSVQLASIFLQTGSVIFECLGLSMQIIQSIDKQLAGLDTDFQYDLEESLQNYVKVLAPKELMACLERVITMDLDDNQESPIGIEADEMISLTKQSALLLANQLINYKHWPEQGDSWIKWRKETGLRQLMLVSESTSSGTMIETLLTNQLALSVYDGQTVVHEIFSKVLQKCLHAVSAAEVASLKGQNKDVPKAQLAMGQEVANICASTTEVPYEALIQFFSFIITKNPTNIPNKEDFKQAFLDQCTVHKSASGNKKDMRVRLKQELLQRREEEKPEEQEKLKGLLQLVKESMNDEEKAEELDKLSLNARLNLKSLQNETQVASIDQILVILGSQVQDAILQIDQRTLQIAEKKTSHVNFNLMKQLSEIVRAYPHLVPVISQTQMVFESEGLLFADWFVNYFTPVFIEHKLVEAYDEVPIEQQHALNLGMLTGFNLLMGFDEQCTKLELRTQVMIQALNSLRNLLPHLKKADQKPDYMTLLKLESSLLTIQSLVHDKNHYEFNRVLQPSDNFSNSLSVLFLHGRKESLPTFTDVVSAMLRCLLDRDTDHQDMRDSLVSSAVNCMSALCEFMIEKRRIKQEEKPAKVEKQPEEEEQQQPENHSFEEDDNMNEQELEDYEDDVSQEPNLSNHRFIAAGAQDEFERIQAQINDIINLAAPSQPQAAFEEEEEAAMYWGQPAGMQRRREQPGFSEETWTTEEDQAQRILMCLRQSDQRTGAPHSMSEENIAKEQEKPGNNSITEIFDCFKSLQTNDAQKFSKNLSGEFLKRYEILSTLLKSQTTNEEINTNANLNRLFDFEYQQHFVQPVVAHSRESRHRTMEEQLQRMRRIMGDHNVPNFRDLEDLMNPPHHEVREPERRNEEARAAAQRQRDAVNALQTFIVQEAESQNVMVAPAGEIPQEDLNVGAIEVPVAQEEEKVEEPNAEMVAARVEADLAIEAANEAKQIAQQATALEQAHLQQQQQVQEEPAEEFLWGYPRSILEAAEIEVELFETFDDELRDECLIQAVGPREQYQPVVQEPPSRSAFDLEPEEPAAEEQPVVEVPVVVAEVEAENVVLQPAAEEAQEEPPVVVEQEEEKQPEVQMVEGIDNEFLLGLDEETRREVIEHHRRQQPGAQPNPINDTLALINSTLDQQLRQDIFLSLEESVLQQLPQNLRTEAERIRRAQAENEARQNDRIARQMQREGIGHGFHGDGYNLFPGDRERMLGPDEQLTNEIQSALLKQNSEQQVDETFLYAQERELIKHEHLLESLLLVFLSTKDRPQQEPKSAKGYLNCRLIQLLAKMTKLKGPVAENLSSECHNKLINALILLLQQELKGECTFANKLLQVEKKKEVQSNKMVVVLTIIGAIRILNQSNKNISIHWLNCLVKGDLPSKVLLSQQSALPAPHTPLLAILATLKDQTQDSLQCKLLMRNCLPLIEENFEDFGKVLDKVKNFASMRGETVMQLIEIINLDQVTGKLISTLANFMLRISASNQRNWSLVHNYCDGLGQSSLRQVNVKLGRVAGALKQEEESEGEEEEEEMPVMELKRKISSQQDKVASLQLVRNLSKNSEQKEVTGEILLTPAVEGRMKQMLTGSCQELTAVQNVFKVYAQFQQKIKPAEEKEEMVPMSESIDTFYDQRDVKAYLVKMDELLWLMAQAKVFGKPASEDKSQNIIQIERLVSQHLQCIFASVEHDLNIMGAAGESEEVREVRMRSITTKKEQHVLLDLFKNSSLVSPRLMDFGKFCLNNKRMINKFIAVGRAEEKKNQKGLTLKLKDIVRNVPNLLDFENKRDYFLKELRKRNNGGGRDLDLTLDRNNIFQDAFQQLEQIPAADFKRKLRIKYNEERGIDAGGVSRDFYIAISKKMFDPATGLFKLFSNGVSFHPDPRSSNQGLNHVKYFQFIGRMVGKAISEEQYMDCYFSKPLYKMMLGEELAFEDFEDMDNNYYQGLKYYLTSQFDADDEELYFSVEEEYFGKTEVIELIPGGKDIKVTNETKQDFLEKITFYEMFGKVKDQCKYFLKGFLEIVPKSLISIFNYRELELLIAGLPEFDIKDLKANMEFRGGFTALSPCILWFWEIIDEFDKTEIALLLSFVTGCSKIPLDGFKSLQGMNGIQKFNIRRMITNDLQRLPEGHTCFNQLDMPEYEDIETMRDRLLYAIKETQGILMA